MEGGGRSRDIYTSSTSFPLCLIVSTLLLSLQISLNSRALAQDKTSCHVTSVKENEPTTFTCIFSVDLRVTRQDVKVIHQSNTETDVVSCTWINKKPSCTSVPGFEVNNTITDRLTIKVPRATLEYNGTYVCHLQGSQSEHFESCDFIVMTGSATTTPVGTIVAVTVGVITAVLVTVTVIIAFIIRKRRSRKPSEAKNRKETKPMIQTPSQDVVKTTKNFLTDLSNGFRKTYPEYNTKSYVVPPLYFNDNTYELTTFAGEDVYITNPPDQQTVKHDMAMGRVLKNLNLLAIFESEVMFVISQFDYKKYLANPTNEFADHSLPMPGELRKSDKHYGDFDILIIHRHHGLVVGVVKTCSGGCQNNEVEVEDTTQMVVEELKQGCKQLDEAEKMLQHLLSDRITNQNQQMQVQKLLILPNLWEERLRIVLNEDQDVAQNLKKCLGFPETADISNKCLCGDHMWSPDRQQNIKKWFNSRFPEAQNKAFASDDEYADKVARFCGPATIWSLNIPDHQSGILPKTLEDCVWMTGELFTKPILQPQQWEILNTNSPRVFLSGPPASGKTRMLVLAGKRWMSDGHKVHVVSTGRKSRAASHVIYTELSMASKEMSGSCELITFEKEDTKERIDKLLKLAKTMYIIADEAYNAKSSSFKDFVDGLRKEVPKLHLWAASCLPNIAPQCCEPYLFKDSFTCPPAILARFDVSQLADKNTVDFWRYDSRTTAPTDGPTVIEVYHDDKGHNGDYPHDCKTCANEVMKLLQTLCVIKSVGANQKVEGQPKLLSKDILVLCENDGETAVSAALKKSGVSVKTVDEKNREQVFEANNNVVWEAKGQHMFGIKRKVVVYVEGNPKDKHKMSVDLKRLRGVTSATSQLIWLVGCQKS
ncbi:uncharacterized protein LOC112574909 isoform X5 [Pomacea canaliculata]|uniref:uncharacterized protein LOC112574909 isoform X5 n=1 Tax=Pomacea canaliculata TaxID=400727 RepID=UPI000D73B38D|nr:uncharacterized protein LOC112574909 isoform X5 [Pomacea canaliculata]XP_025112064.1 uncharacterized protein LOC112574909 isoform X5 [Pomacea canaliculata]XP_025112066.1 uncharacterized protein LOC112574909 isoform X5 [Pomacea canaliculata]XP_025112067.1 uncharacterized protein LOC112574909 isoform X5 [Pomacea canaliculata]